MWSESLVEMVVMGRRRTGVPILPGALPLLGALGMMLLGALLTAGARPATTTTEYPEGFAENGTNNGQYIILKY